MKSKKYIWGTLIVLAAISYGCYKYIKANQLKHYWLNINTATDYQGDGYKITFPCSDLKQNTIVSDQDLNSTEESCTYYGGQNHSDIDMYQVETSHFLSTAYSPAADVACGNPYDPSSNTYFNETRSLDGYQIVLCGKDAPDEITGKLGPEPITAKVQVKNTVYTMKVLPSDEKTTAGKLDDFIRSFQLTF